MAVSLPVPGSNGADDHEEISRKFVEHAREELEKGNNLQASEKIWGAAAHAVKAIAVQRGWRHGRHDFLFDIAGQVGKEFNRPDLLMPLGMAEALHVNFYENTRDEDFIQAAIDAIEQFVTDLEELRSLPPRPFTVATQAEQNRLQRLLGRRVPMGAHSDVGFVRQRRGRQPR